MKTVEKLSAFVECFYKNIVTRVSLFILLFSFVLFKAEMYWYFAIFFFYGIVPLLMTLFGFSSYNLYKISYEKLESGHYFEDKTYCGHVAAKVAERRFKRKRKKVK